MCARAALSLGEMGMPRRFAYYHADFETMHTVLSVGRWMAACGFGAAVVLHFTRSEPQHGASDDPGRGAEYR